MSNNKLEQRIRHSLDAELSGLGTTSWQRNQFFENATGGNKVKKKITYSLVLAAVLIIALAGIAYAVTNALGILDYAKSGRLETEVPDDAAMQIIHDLAKVETEHATFVYREVLYDGKSFYVVYDIIPKEKGMLIFDAPRDESWYFQTHFNPDGQEMKEDSRTIIDRWDEGCYTSAWEVDIDISAVDDEDYIGVYGANVGTLDEKTGIFTGQMGVNFESMKQERKIVLGVSIRPVPDMHDEYSVDYDNQECAYIEHVFQAADTGSMANPKGQE